MSTKARTPEEKFVTLFDAAKKSLLIIDFLYSDFEATTKIAGDSKKLAGDGTTMARLYATALGLVDYFHRFHQIVQAMPLLNQRLPETRKLSSRMKSVEATRHYLQHMRRELSQNDPVEYPVLGCISWIEEGRCITVAPQQPTPKAELPTIFFDRLRGVYVCKYQIALHKHDVPLDTVYSEIKTFWKWLDGVIQIEPSFVKAYEWGTPTAITTTVVSETHRPLDDR